MSQRTGNNGSDIAHGGQQVIDFSEVRAQKLDEKRRTTERIFFKHLLSRLLGRRDLDDVPHRVYRPQRRRVLFPDPL